MGIANSKRELNPEDYPAIWISEPTIFSDFTTTRFPTDQASKPVALKDSALWDEFAHKMNERVILLNRYLGPLYIVYAIVVALCVAIGVTGIVPQFQLLVIPAVIVSVGGHAVIVDKNKRHDVEIAKIIESYQNRFVDHGIQIEYVTESTHFCKPRHKRAMRVVLFKPAVNTMNELT